MKRICLFAGYDPEGIIDEYVIHYLKELSQHADIHYLADCDIASNELSKIAPYTISSSAYQHNKYDFGSWSELIKEIGWEEIEKYDELILANDSQYLVGDIGSFLSIMENQHLDFWAGLAVHEHYAGGRQPLDQFISSTNILETSFTFVSSFMAFSKNLFSKEYTQHFLSQIIAERDRLQVAYKYEVGLTRILIRHNVNYGLFIEDIYSYSSIYTNSAFYFLRLGYPFIKIKVFFSQYYPVIAPLGRLEYLKYQNPSLNTTIIIKHINRLQALNSQKKNLSQRIIEGPFRPIIMFIVKLVYLILPTFITRFVRRLIERYEIYAFEAQFFKSKIYYFSKFITTIPEQRKLAKKLKDKKKIILFFNDSRDIITGGMLSVNRFVEKTKEIPFLSDYEVVVSGVPIINPPVKYSYFDSAIPQIKFSRITEYCNPEKLLIHIPEVLALIFYENLSEKEKEWLVKIPNLQINILDQNNQVMPERSVIRNLLSQLTENITITTAHHTSCTQQLSNKYSTPVHQLTPFLPEFLQVDFEEKDKTILLSNDNNLFGSTKLTKKDIVENLKRNLPDFQIQEIQRIPLEEYKKLITKSLFTISFGEGFDGYFLEPILSKSLSFAVFNPFYFPSEFLNSEIVYKSWEELFDQIVNDINYFANNKSAYEHNQSINQHIIGKYISNEKSIRELENFYKKEYDYIPGKVKYELFDDTKSKLERDGSFKFFDGPTSDNLVLAPDGNLYHNMRGDFYIVLDEIYIENTYNFSIKDDFILIDLGFHAGIASLHLKKKHKNLKQVFGFEAMQPTAEIAWNNIKINKLEKFITLKSLALSDKFEIKNVPYIPDWASKISVEENLLLYEMLSTSEMRDEIRYVETEIVPAHTELKSIIENAQSKIVLKCDTRGSEKKIIQDLDEYGLLHKIDLVIIKSAGDPQPILACLQKNTFAVEEVIYPKHVPEYKIYAVKE